ncbi:histone H4 transcription factor-like [Homalodisca vitripennis]|uniref:histone H4 transcription factor-like n=1 Tax=Homalodisca vitripennis TaxID=197043 RepID=UPI001EEA7FA3|nr:histone H4 transcription factor-like [Homalodisca vitripennis]
MLSKSQKLVLGNCSPDLSGDEDTKLSSYSSNSEKTSPALEVKEDYEQCAVDNESKELEISDIHRTDDHVDEKDNGVDSDSDDSILSRLNKGTIQSSKRKKNLTLFDLHFKCEWKNCTYETEDDSKFHVHVSYHIPDLEIKTMSNGEEVYVCLWAECTYLTGGVNEIQRHVTYHSYHTKLKIIGEKVQQQWNLPKCRYGKETRNMIPEKIDPMVCEWEDCHKEFNNVQVFLYHIQTHINETCYDIFPKKKKIKCKWEGCTMTTDMPSRVRLSDHVRTHTKERVVGCPTCGHLFSTNTKLNDHCMRQVSSDLECQCSHCYKEFPHLRLLKDHMRGHVNFYQCCYCEMTCTSRHTFSAHIRYKHLDSKPFKCSMCSYECKTKYDLKKHLATHDPKTKFECEDPSCNYSCKTKSTLQRHVMEVHQGAKALYCCHIADCNSRYKRGCYLTKHLMTKHCLRWPSGHSRFIYHRQEDGTYRLQTVRYESVKLYGENKTSDLSVSKNNFKLTPLQADGSRSFKVSKIESDTSSGMSQVLISIEDESGNTINSCTAPEVVGDKIPKNAMVIASADSMDVEEESS